MAENDIQVPPGGTVKPEIPRNTEKTFNTEPLKAQARETLGKIFDSLPVAPQEGQPPASPSESPAQGNLPEAAAPAAPAPSVTPTENWNMPFKKEDTFQLPTGAEGEFLEVTGEQLVELAKGSAELESMQEELESRQQMVRGAEVLDYHFRRIPGLKEYVAESIQTGQLAPLPNRDSGGRFISPEKSASEAIKGIEKALENPNIDENLRETLKAMATSIASSVEASVGPLKKELEWRRNVDIERARAEQFREQQKVVGERIDSALKGYPIFKDQALRALAEETIKNRLHAMPNVSLNRIVHDLAVEITSTGKKTNEKRIEDFEKKKELQTAVGAGLSPTTGLPKPLNGRDMEKGETRRSSFRYLSKIFGK